MQTCLTYRGYSIPICDLTQKQVTDIKKQLTITPNIGCSSINVIPKSFIIYRESPTKLIVPRYFGEKMFGPPNSNKLTTPIKINVPFVGKLRPNQEIAINSFNKNIKLGGGGGLFEIPCGEGKTVDALYIISMLGVKSICVVNKDFLANQWIERIKEYLPSARIGRIQQNITDVNDKDIVIVMLQSLSMRDYSKEIFNGFGLTIYDEVHHISSEVFSQALFKTVTPYTLGLSATMNRKDGTTHVFKLFLGDILCTIKRQISYSVNIHVTKYRSNDSTFNETVCDYRGKVQYSSMITKLCDYMPRTLFIIDIIQSLITKSPHKQILVLAHNRNILSFIHDIINEKNIATVGYYVGGMKQAQLTQSETKQVIVATYSMAAEALDIKTLSVLIMATPKPEIEQAIGRLFRGPHSDEQTTNSKLERTVIDIVDYHQLFQRHLQKRKVFYRREKYNIIDEIAINNEDDNDDDILKKFKGKCII